jgi:hypothetical protein
VEHFKRNGDFSSSRQLKVSSAWDGMTALDEFYIFATESVWIRTVVVMAQFGKLDIG